MQKMLDMSVISLEALLTFVAMDPIRSQPEQGGGGGGTEEEAQPPPPSLANARALLLLLIETHENLNLLQNIVDLTHFKTEVKKKPGMPEDIEGMALEAKARQLACKMIATLSVDLLTESYDKNACGFFYTIPSVANSICEALKIVYESDFVDEDKKPNALVQIDQ